MSGEYDREDLVREIKGYALKNAYEHGGKAVPGPVISKVLGRHPKLREKAREIAKLVREIVEEINKLSPDEQERQLKEEYSFILEKYHREEKPKSLPKLPKASKYKVIRTRFAPNPDFLIHLGNARPALLSYEYSRMYKGRMILRFEDTDPKTKPPLPEAYRLIKEDLRWLGIRWDEEYIQSLRMEIYYKIAEELIRKGGAYVDLCSQKEFRKYKLSGKPCPHRNQSIDKNIELFDKMKEGYFDEGSAVLRVKTDLKSPDPSVIDWVAFRIINTDRHPHPIVGSRYIVWPTYNFAAGVDDHLMGITHILRGKEHSVNTLKQSYLYRHLGWEYPEVINLGRLHLEGLILSKSLIKALIKENPGKFSGPDDIRFGTIASLRNRGIEAETIRQLIMEVGVKPTDAKISWENIAAANRKIIDSRSRRFMGVFNPVKVIIRNYSGPAKLELPNHPENEDLGKRVIKIPEAKEIEVFAESNDVADGMKSGGLRLMEFCNVEDIRRVNDIYIAHYIGGGVEQAKRKGYKIVQWVPSWDYVKLIVKVPEKLELTIKEGVAEPEVRRLKIGEKIQFVRFGFIKVEKVLNGLIYAIYMHR